MDCSRHIDPSSYMFGWLNYITQTLKLIFIPRAKQLIDLCITISLCQIFEKSKKCFLMYRLKDYTVCNVEYIFNLQLFHF